MPEENKDKDKDKNYFDFPDKLESLLMGLVQFGKRFAITFRDLAFNHAAFRQNFTATGRDRVYVKPYTFLTILTFFMIRTLRVTMVILILSISTLFRGCDGQTYPEIEYPSVLKSLTLPALDEILLIGVPMFFGIVLLALLIKCILFKRSQELKKDDHILKCTCYAVGFQYATYLILVLGYFGVDHLAGRYPKIQPDESYQPALELVLQVALVAIFLWPALIFYRFLSNRYRAAHFRVGRRYFRHIFLFGLSMGLVAGALLMGSAMVYPLAHFDLERMRINVNLPEVSIALIEFDVVEKRAFYFELLASNNTKEKLHLMSSQLEYLHGDFSYLGVIRDATGTNAPVFVLGPGEQRWLSARFDGESRRRDSEFFWDPDGIMEFKNLQRDGSRRSIRSKVNTGSGTFTLPLQVRPFAILPDPIPSSNP